MISSPVARLPIAARIYTMSIIALMFILMAVHFSIQAKAQQQAEQWVTTWKKQYHGQTGEVRLHMLRGALSIHDLTWHSETPAHIRLHIPFILLRGDLSKLMEHLDIHEVILHNATLHIPTEYLHNTLLQHKPLTTWLPWLSLLQTSKHVHAKNLTLILQPKDKPTALTIHHADFSSTPKQHTWQLSGNLWHGNINIQATSQHSDITLSNLHAKNVTSSLGLSSIQGIMNGQARIQNKQLSGNLEWINKQSSKTTPAPGTLAFQGDLTQQAWQLKVDANNWPLQIFSTFTPMLHGRTLTSAYLQGVMQIKGSKDAWKANIQTGKIKQLHYQSTAKDDWQLDDIEFKQAKLLWPERALKIKQIDIKQGRWAVDSTSSMPSTVSSTDWKLDLSKVHFSAIQLGDLNKDIWLSEMQGMLSLHHNYLNLTASSDTTLMGQWNIKAKGLLEQPRTGLPLELQISAEHVPLVYFRDALPQTFAKNARLNGDIHLDLQGDWNQQGWQLKGNLNAQNMMWNKGSWLWQAEQVRIQDVSFSSQQAPHIDTLYVYHWSGQTSLTPWAQTESITSPENNPVFTLNDWQIKHLHMNYGEFSLGQADAVWLHADEIKLDTLISQQAIAVHVQGTLADGDFQLRGSWFPWGTSPWMHGNATLRNALPFVAAPWLQISNLPMITRGRVSAKINVNDLPEQPHHYQALMAIQLKHAHLQNGIFPNQAFVKSTGYDVNALFDRIHHDVMHLNIPLQGNWESSPLNGYRLGQGLLEALAHKATSEAPEPKETSIQRLSNIRLHDSSDGRIDSLKHNERVRLRKVLHSMWRKPKWIIELLPQLGEEPLNPQLEQRVRKTQQQIEAFLVARGISAARIFPIWPNESHRQGQSTGIIIQAVK